MLKALLELTQDTIKILKNNDDFIKAYAKALRSEAARVEVIIKKQENITIKKEDGLESFAAHERWAELASRTKQAISKKSELGLILREFMIQEIKKEN